MKALPFLLPYLVSSIIIVGYLTKQLWLFRLIGWVWLIVAVLDFVVLPKSYTSIHNQVANVKRPLAWRLLVRFWVLIQIAIIACGLSISSWSHLNLQEFVFVTSLIGIVSGMFCIPVAHELMHGKGRLEKVLAEILMTTVSYTHFCIEHVQGHHRNVGTVNDPATADVGEGFYTFYPRTVLGGVASAWNIEKRRLRRLGYGLWNYRNRMNRYFVILCTVYATIFYFFGWRGIIFFAVQSVIAFTMLEVFNYVEHYGLTRRQTSKGHYERIMPWHSWDSNHRISNWMLFNLGRHSDHHCQPAKSYQFLVGRKEAPQLPTGYFLIFLLPLIPFLWRRVMDSRLQMWRIKHQGLTNVRVGEAALQNQ